VAVVDAGAPSVGGCLRPGAIIRCRPVGALVMEDEAGGDEKLLAVPIEALHPFYTGIRSYRDLPAIMCQQIAHFFQHYKDLKRENGSQ
jgi:inorganic pyrophosphatase